MIWVLRFLMIPFSKAKRYLHEQFSAFTYMQGRAALLAKREPLAPRVSLVSGG